MAIAPAAPFAIDAEVVAILVLALFCFLAITIIDSTRRPIVGLAGSVPVVGNPLGGAVDSAIGTLRGWLYNGLSGGLVVFAATVQWLHDRFAQLTGTLGGLADLAAAADLKIVRLVVPALIADALGVLEGTEAVARAALAQALAVESSARVAADAALATAIEDTRSAVVADIEALGAAATVAIDQGVAAAEAYAQDVGKAVLADASALVAQETAAALAAVQALGIATGAELEGVLGRALAEDRQLEQVLAADLGDVRAVVGDLQAILAGAGVGSLAAVIADVAAIRALRCIQNCASLGDLGDLLTALDPLLLVAFAAAWRQDQASGRPSFAGAIIATAKDLSQGAVSVATP